MSANVRKERQRKRKKEEKKKERRKKPSDTRDRGDDNEAISGFLSSSLLDVLILFSVFFFSHHCLSKQIRLVC